MQIGVLVRKTFLGGRNNLISLVKPQGENKKAPPFFCNKIHLTGKPECQKINLV